MNDEQPIDYSTKATVMAYPVLTKDVHVDVNFPSAETLRNSKPKALEWWVVRAETKKRNNDGFNVWHWRDYHSARIMPTDMETKLIDMGYKVAVEDDRTKFHVSWEDAGAKQ